jgi:hypothetical protein
MTFGIPYAKAIVTDDGVLVSECPICGIPIAEEHDTTGEQTTNRYGDHYVQHHGVSFGNSVDIRP